MNNNRNQLRNPQDQDSKQHRNLYSKQESKNIEKYDILGSGNFEIIRGGILDKSDNNQKNKQQNNIDKLRPRKKLPINFNRLQGYDNFA
ncbi:hypothetical protein DERP_006143 [Dermatophagoides pteronyssinus]|uniref:Uncharacterized protein n=1 Tax=Dermatophagoides pteronyssinus TaxID=6956 RepID=A0ABQ8JSH9_DERPT|nr:hypothetical protein DERP_006143 [Dermatophagoides pteronyssinus]